MLSVAHIKFVPEGLSVVPDAKIRHTFHYVASSALQGLMDVY